MEDITIFGTSWCVDCRRAKKFLQERGVIAYGFTPMVLDAATAATMHSDSERIPLEEFKTGLHIFYDVLKQQ